MKFLRKLKVEEYMRERSFYKNNKFLYCVFGPGDGTSRFDILIECTDTKNKNKNIFAKYFLMLVFFCFNLKFKY